MPASTRPLAPHLRRLLATHHAGLRAPSVRRLPTAFAGFAPSAPAHCITARGLSSTAPLREKQSQNSRAESLDYPTSPAAFPWLLPGSPPRRTSYPPDDPSPFRRLFVFPIVRLLVRVFNENFVRSAFGPSYLDTHFILGASTAVSSLAKAISSPPDTDWLSRACTRTLAARLESAFAALAPRVTRARDADGREIDVEVEDSVTVTVHAVHDVVVRDVWVTFGPEVKQVTGDGVGMAGPKGLRIRDVFRGFTVYEASAGYFLIKFMTIAWLVPRDDWLSGRKSSLQVVTGASSEGAVVTIDADIDAEWSFTHVRRTRPASNPSDTTCDTSAATSTDSTSTSQTTQTLYTLPRTRRPLILSFTSQHFAVPDTQAGPASPFSPAVGAPGGAPGPVEPRWRVADVDRLVESEVWEYHLEKMRGREGEEA